MKNLLLLPSAIIGLLLFGCASPDGPKYSMSGDAGVAPPNDLALVFIYRTPNFVDSATDWIVGINGQSWIIVPNGGYFYLPVAPGAVRFTSRYDNTPLNFGLGTLFNKDREVLKLDAQAGKTYYLKLFSGGLRGVPEGKAKGGLKKCWKIPVIITNEAALRANTR